MLQSESQRMNSLLSRLTRTACIPPELQFQRFLLYGKYSFSSSPRELDHVSSSIVSSEIGKYRGEYLGSVVFCCFFVCLNKMDMPLELASGDFGSPSLLRRLGRVCVPLNRFYRRLDSDNAIGRSTT